MYVGVFLILPLLFLSGIYIYIYIYSPFTRGLLFSWLANLQLDKSKSSLRVHPHPYPYTGVYKLKYWQIGGEDPSLTMRTVVQQQQQQQNIPNKRKKKEREREREKTTMNIWYAERSRPSALTALLLLSFTRQ